MRLTLIHPPIWPAEGEKKAFDWFEILLVDTEPPDIIPQKQHRTREEETILPIPVKSKIERHDVIKMY